MVCCVQSHCYPKPNYDQVLDFSRRDLVDAWIRESLYSPLAAAQAFEIGACIQCSITVITHSATDLLGGLLNCVCSADLAYGCFCKEHQKAGTELAIRAYRSNKVFKKAVEQLYPDQRMSPATLRSLHEAFESGHNLTRELGPPSRCGLGVMRGLRYDMLNGLRQALEETMER